MTDTPPEVNPIECCSKPLEFRVVEGKSWRAYKPEAATCVGCETSYERKPGNGFAYKRVGEGYFCTGDGETILSGKVAHPIWDGPFEGAGSGKCNYEDVPYCPKHEERPRFSGVPIRVPMRSDGTLDMSNL